MSAGGKPAGRAREHLSGAPKGAEPQRGFGGSPQSQSQGKRAPLPGGAQAPQPLLQHPQRRAAETGRDGSLSLVPAARRQAETAPPADAAEAGAPGEGQRSGGPVRC